MPAMDTVAPQVCHGFITTFTMNKIKSPKKLELILSIVDLENEINAPMFFVIVDPRTHLSVQSC